MSKPEMNTAGQERAEKILKARQNAKKSKWKEEVITFINFFGFIGWLLFFEFMLFDYVPRCF